MKVVTGVHAPAMSGYVMVVARNSAMDTEAVRAIGATAITQLPAPAKAAITEPALGIIATAHHA